MVQIPEPTLIADTREPIPYEFTCPTIRATLRTGDYSLLDFQDQIAVERKQLNDLIACLGRERSRFEAELTRAQSFQYFCVLVEAPYEDLVNGHYISRMNPKSAVESISTFEVRYKIPFLFCGTQALAARKCESLLRKFHREKMLELDSEIPF